MISASELEALLEENEDLRLEIRRLQSGRPQDLCWSCEVKRRWLAGASGSAIALPILSSSVNLDATFSAFLGLLWFGPFVGVIVSWKIRLFKRNETWKDWPLYKAYVAYEEARRQRQHRR